MTDVKLTDSAVIVEGNLGIGTSSPAGLLHINGSEVLSTGPVAGYSFADRSDNSKRWVLYADKGSARLWNGADALQVSSGQLSVDTVRCKTLYADHIFFGIAEGTLIETMNMAHTPASTPGVRYSGQSVQYGIYNATHSEAEFAPVADVVTLLLTLQARVEALEKAIKK